MSITLGIIDSQDGTHGTAVIGGIDVDVQWFVHFQAPNSDVVASTSGTGPGSYPITVPSAGVYWFTVSTGTLPYFQGPVRVYEITDGSIDPGQQVADSIANLINSNVALPDSAIARRGYVPGYTLEQLENLQVTVVCRTSMRELDDRNGSKPTYIVEIGIQKKVQIQEDDSPAIYLANQIAACDPYLSICNRILNLLALKENRQRGPGHWTGDENNPLYSYQDLVIRMVFNGLLQVTYYQNDDLDE